MNANQPRSWDGLFPETLIEKLRAFFVKRNCGDDSDDLTQDVLVKAWKYRDQLRNDSPDAWLFTIAARVFADYVNGPRSKRKQEVSLDASTSENHGLDERLPDQKAQSQESHLFERERALRLKMAMEALPKKGRACLMLYLNGKSYEEIADLLCLSMNTVGSHIHQAKAKLKREMGGEA